MITFEIEGAQFNYRTVGIVLHGDRVLLHRSEMDDLWSLPGGRVEMLESAGDALKREMKEELDVGIRVERLIWVVENFFEYDSKPYHEIAFYFLMTFPRGSHLYERDEPFMEYDNGFKLIFRWYRLDELKKLELYPMFLKERLKSLPENMEHIVHTD